MDKIRGKYIESKAGPMVDGVILISSEFDENFRNKVVEVTGTIVKDHEYKIKPYVPGKPVSQGFDMPIMKEIKSIKVIG